MREITGISEQTFPDNGSISDLESELQTDQSVLGSPIENSAGINKGLSSCLCFYFVSFAVLFDLVIFIYDIQFITSHYKGS